jgi:hypothetical protein
LQKHQRTEIGPLLCRPPDEMKYHRQRDRQAADKE